MKFIVVRHGQTIENAERIVQGQLPGTLSELGIQQAEEVAEKLKDQKFDDAWSSDLLRCVKTGEHILKYHPDLKLNLTPALREQNFGTYQGKPGPIDWANYKGNLLSKRLPSGETLKEVYMRVINFLNYLFEESPGRKILIVTHGGPIRTIISSYEGIPLVETFKEEQPNVGIWEFVINQPLEPNLEDKYEFPVFSEQVKS